LGLFYEHENIGSKDQTNDAGLFDIVRGNLYFSYKSPLSNTITLKSTTYLQPNLEDLNDIRLLESAKINFAFSENISLQFTLKLTYDNDPPQAIQKEDASYTSGIRYKF
jgi:hypothetical protein